MGLLTIKTGQEDYDAVEFVAEQVAILWNDFGGQDHGFRVVVSKADIKKICDKSNEVLTKFFPTPPSPFKRVAALLVFGRLYPFFGFEPRQISSDLHDKWLSRILALLIPATLPNLEVNLSSQPSKTEKWVRLNNWTGFPSAHFKIEFLLFLEWLQNHHWPAIDEKWEDETAKRIARIILSCALQLESCYYLCEWVVLPDGKTKKGLVRVQGSCLGCLHANLDLTPLSYDIRLLQAQKGEDTGEKSDSTGET